MGKTPVDKPGRPTRLPGDNPLNLDKMAKRKVSPLNDRIWRLILEISSGVAGAWLLALIGLLYFAVGAWLVAAILLGAWITAARMLFLETRLRWGWLIWLSASMVLVIVFNFRSDLWIAAVCMTTVFLVFRTYKPYRHLTSRRRAILFGICFGLFLLVTVFWRFPYPALSQALVETAGGTTGPAAIGFVTGLGLNIAEYSVWSLRFFLVLSMTNLFFRVRLHFMKIRPKLAVSGFLLTIVPLVLLAVIALALLYAVLGESRASRASSVLYEWASLAGSDENLMPVLGGETFTYGPSGGVVSRQGSGPPWLQDFLQAEARDPGSIAKVIPAGSGVYFWRDSELWLVVVTRQPQSGIRIQVAKVGRPLMERLAGLVRADVIISASNPINLNALKEQQGIKLETGKEIVGLFSPESSPRLATRATGAALSGKATPFSKRRLYFGMTHLNIVTLGQGRFEELSLLLILRTSLSDLEAEIFSQKNPLGMAFMIAIASVAGLMLILEVFALVFGLRIAGGITSAVKALYQGTKRIAESDFDTPILIPNEDELGELSSAFNEMAAAVKQGREEAVAREKLEQELKVARQIQERLLPHVMPSIPGFEISGTSLPSEQVGGDYFDFLEIQSGQLGIAVADVSGKGIPAALLMANLQASLHGQAMETGDAAAVVGNINNLLARSTDAHMFATFFYGILDRNRSLFTYANAGHNPPFLFHADGSSERLSSGGLLLGFLLNQAYEQKTLPVRAGDVLVLFTDGITEAANPDPSLPEMKYFGDERLAEVIRTNLERSAIEIQAAILKAVMEHMGGTEASDDITLVVIKRGAEADLPLLNVQSLN